MPWLNLNELVPCEKRQGHTAFPSFQVRNTSELSNERDGSEEDEEEVEEDVIEFSASNQGETSRLPFEMVPNCHSSTQTFSLSLCLHDLFPYFPRHNLKEGYQKMFWESKRCLLKPVCPSKREEKKLLMKVNRGEVCVFEFREKIRWSVQSGFCCFIWWVNSQWISILCIKRKRGAVQWWQLCWWSSTWDWSSNISCIGRKKNQKP